MSRERWSTTWLVNRIHDEAVTRALCQYATGVLVDIGCGAKPYSVVTKGLTSSHVGLDHPGSIHRSPQVDLLATAYKTSLADGSADTILCTVVLEHLERPQDAVNEISRILKPGAHVVLSAPLYWHLHEEPRDFYRYTKYGLEHLCSAAGLKVLEIKPLSGFVVTFNQQLVSYLSRLRRGPFVYPVALLQAIIQRLAFWLNRWDRSHSFTWAYLAVAAKPAINEPLE